MDGGDGDAPRVKLPPRWRLIRPLGEGGQARVWLAEDRELGEQVALKIFGAPAGPAARERWRREVRLGRRLQHPNLLRLYDLLELDGTFVAVMEAVFGGTLAERVEKGPLPVEEVVVLAERMLEVLDHLHREGVVHRDVKPSNILFDGAGVPKLGDLGLAREVEGEVTVTATRTAVGTPAYMAPEQLRGGKPSPSWDLYALGVTLYEALTGRPPFQGGSGYEVADGHLHRGAPSPRRLRRDCPVWLSRLVERLLEKAPEHRWPDAAGALEALRRRRVRTAPTVRRRLTMAAAAAVVVLGAAGVVARMAWNARDLAVVSVLGGRVTALDRERRELWRYAGDGKVLHAAAGNFLPLWGHEALLVCLTPPADRGTMPLVVDVLDRGGTSRTRWRLQPAAGWEVPAAGWELSGFRTGDMDGDGLDEAVLLCNHRLWYPGEVQLVSRLGGDRGPRSVLANSGHLEAVALGDLDGDGVRDLVVAGLNNVLGFQAVVTALSGSEILAGMGACSPELALQKGAMASAYLKPVLFYTPLGSIMPVGNTALRLSLDEAGIELGGSVGRVLLDRDGNPQGSPLAGSGPGPRREFWNALLELCRSVREHPGSWRGEWTAFSRREEQVLKEHGSFTAAALLASGSLAGEGAYRGATEILESAVERLPGERDLWLRLGEYRLLEGDRRAGRRAVLRSLGGGSTGRNAYDACLILALDAAMNLDEGAFREAVNVLRHDTESSRNLGEMRGLVQQIRLFVEGRWTDPRIEEPVKRALIPEAEWIRWWVRLERGEDPAGVLAAVRRHLQVCEAPGLGRILEAECLRRMGRPGEALRVADRVLTRLSIRGRCHFETFVWVPMAEWEAGRCLLDAGRPGGARGHLGAAARGAPRTWFGRDAARLLHGA